MEFNQYSGLTQLMEKSSLSSKHIIISVFLLFPEETFCLNTL